MTLSILLVIVAALTLVVGTYLAGRRDSKACYACVFGGFVAMVLLVTPLIEGSRAGL